MKLLVFETPDRAMGLHIAVDLMMAFNGFKMFTQRHYNFGWRIDVQIGFQSVLFSLNLKKYKL